MVHKDMYLVATLVNFKGMVCNQVEVRTVNKNQQVTTEKEDKRTKDKIKVAKNV